MPANEPTPCFFFSSSASDRCSLVEGVVLGAGNTPDAAAASFLGCNALFWVVEPWDVLAALAVSPIIGDGSVGAPLPNCSFLRLGMPRRTPETTFCPLFDSRLLDPLCMS